MQYSFKEIHALNLLSDNPEYSKRFNTPADLKIMTLVILAVLATAIGSAIVFKVDKIVPAQGVLETRAKLFEVRSPSSGFVDTIHVAEGDAVSAGEAIVSFDTELLDLEIDRLQQQLATLSRSVWTDYYLIRDWLNGETRASLEERLASVPNAVEALGYQGYLERSLAHSLAALDQSIGGYDARHAALSSQILWLREAAAMEQADLDRLVRLKEQGIESQSSVDAQQRAVLDIKSQLEALKSEQATIATEKDRTVLDRSKVQDDFVLERLLRLQDQLDQYNQTISQLASQRRERENMIVRAPFAAVIDQVQARGRHEVLEAGAALADIRPLFDQGDLEIDIQIPSNYAIWVSPGMEFRASSLGNNPEDHGRLHGVVGFVSKSSNIVEGQRMYRMTGNITKLEVNDAETFLRPGLQLSVEIKAGERPLINYIFDPFTKHLRTALSEPS